MPEKGTTQWTLRKTPARESRMALLRELLEELHPSEGERIHGQLTDAQIFDWALERLHTALSREYISERVVEAPDRPPAR